MGGGTQGARIQWGHLPEVTNGHLSTPQCLVSYLLNMWVTPSPSQPIPPLEPTHGVSTPDCLPSGPEVEQICHQPIGKPPLGVGGEGARKVSYLKKKSPKDLKM